MNEVTRILSAIDHGEAGAAEKLLPLVYNELRQLAARKLAREKEGHTLDATALVHEAFLRLVQRPSGGREPADPSSDQGADAPRSGGAEFANRGHFFAAAAEAMRRILIENARRRRSGKHGGGHVRRDLDKVEPTAPEPPEDLLALDAALTKLAQRDPQKAKLVELRYFAGLTGEQAAAVLGISPSTADRHWVYARAWLRRELSS